MKIAHFHLPNAGGGLATRIATLEAALGAVSVSDVDELLAGFWGCVLVDTYPQGKGGILRDALDELRARGTTLVLLARALNEPEATTTIYDVVVGVGPYERAGGREGGPLVTVPIPLAEPDIDVLVIASTYTWGLAARARLIAAAGREVTVLARGPLDGWPGPVVTGRGVDVIGRARVVVGGGGTGTLYETLWSGGRLVAHPFNEEQRIRTDAARLAGEAVTSVWALDETLDAIDRVEAMAPLGPRPNGVLELTSLVASMDG